ncbi:MAG: Kelch repeat-containing protein [Phycisphaerales bacterium]
MTFDDSRGRVVMFGGTLGGINSSQPLGELWTFRPDGNWEFESLITPSEPRGVHLGVLAYLPRANQLYQFGSLNQNFNDTLPLSRIVPSPSQNPNLPTQYLWQSVLLSSPTARGYTTLTFEPNTQRLILFGGITAAQGAAFASPTNETWAFNGFNWVELTLNGPAPQPRFAHAAAFDPSRGRLVVLGGLDQNGTALGDTIEFDWSSPSWRSIVPPTDPRFGAAMAYDASRRVTVAFGGERNGTTTSEVLESQGGAWMVRQLPGPSPRSFSAMAYDPARQSIVMFGGLGNNGVALNDTWELRPNPLPIITGQPIPTDVTVGRPITLDCLAQSSATLAYQWRRDGNPLPHQQQPVLQIPSALLSDAGVYDCVVHDGCRSVTSMPVVVVVRPFCRADFDQNGIISPDDLADFITTFFEQCE